MRMWTKVTLTALVAATAVRAADWPQWMGPTRDGVWTETGTIDAIEGGKLETKWRVPCEAGYAGPAVADGKVYLFDFVSKDPIVNHPGAQNERRGTERLQALDAKTGKEIWTFKRDTKIKVSYPSGPRCTPTVAGGKVYILGAEGVLTCLDAATGGFEWSKNYQEEYGAPKPMWGFTCHPLVDGDRVYCGVGGADALLVCFNAADGKEIWKTGKAVNAGYSAPVIAELHGKRQLLFFDPEKLAGYDPETGKKLWSIDIKPMYEMSIMRPIVAGDVVFVGGIGEKSVAVRVGPDNSVKELYRGSTKSGVHPVNSTPLVDGAHAYGVDTRGPLLCVELATGKRLWSELKPVGPRPQNSGTAFLVKNGDKYFVMSETGELIVAKLSPEKYEELGRAKILEPTSECFGRNVVWSHPAFADKCIFARNDKELVCVSLAK